MELEVAPDCSVFLIELSVTDPGGLNDLFVCFKNDDRHNGLTNLNRLEFLPGPAVDGGQ